MSYTSRKATVVEVFTNEDITGVSIAGGTATTMYTESPLKDVICGEDPFDVEKIWHKVYMSWRKPVAKVEKRLEPVQ